jgi:hypothetical protein
VSQLISGRSIFAINPNFGCVPMSPRPDYWAASRGRKFSISRSSARAGIGIGHLDAVRR